jgi:RNA polymerase sigma-70 factor (ECF subfamily)
MLDRIRGRMAIDGNRMVSHAKLDRGAKPDMDWPALLAQHDRWLRTVVYARLQEAQAVDDVMQEVALAAVKQAAPLSDPAKAGPWLYRLAIRQTLLYRRGCGRRRKLRERFVERCAPSESDANTPEPLEWLLARERRQLVRVALDRLPPRDAELLLLKYTENWDYHRIAEQLGVSHSAVETRLHRARARMRQELMSLQVIEAPR